MNTKIEWADHTINPTVGCMKCSPGCANCYAERFAARLVKKPQTAAKYAGVVDQYGHWTGKISEPDYSVFERLPKKPQRVFLGSMSDLFFRGVNDYGRKALKTDDGKLYEFAPDTMHARIARLLVQIGRYPQHTFMMLTKRPEAMGEALDLLLKRPLLNLWVGVTVCNQEEADEKIPLLLDIPAALRFISFEPLLGPVSMWRWFPEGACQKPAHEAGRRFIKNTEYENGIHWVICGGETGPGARPMHPDWVRSLCDQCQAAGTPFFFKGWGEWVAVSYDDFPDWQRRDSGKGIFANLDPERGMFWNRDCAYKPDENGIQRKIYGTDLMRRVGKRRAGRLLDGVEYNEFPEA